MTERNVFGLVVRCTGFLGIVAAGLDVIHLGFVQLGLPLVSRYPQEATAAAAIAYFVGGVGLLLSARTIVQLVYGADEPRT